MSENRVAILGTRGVAAQHGGFETFAEHLSTYLVEKGVGRYRLLSGIGS